MIDKILKDWNDRVGGNLNHEKEKRGFNTDLLVNHPFIKGKKLLRSDQVI